MLNDYISEIKDSLRLIGAEKITESRVADSQVTIIMKDEQIELRNRRIRGEIL